MQTRERAQCSRCVPIHKKNSFLSLEIFQQLAYLWSTVPIFHSLKDFASLFLNAVLFSFCYFFFPMIVCIVTAFHMF